MVAVGSPYHSRPRETDTQVTAHAVTFNNVPILINQYRLYPRQGQHSITRFGWRNTRDRCDHVPAVFGLPPGIHNRAFFMTDLFIVPMPCFFVYRFAHGAQLFKRAQVLAFNKAIAKAHQRADGRWCGIYMFTLNFSTISQKRPASG